MYNREQKIMESWEKNRIGLDDVFTFGCRECGKCCKNRTDILLTARDIYNIAKKLEISVEEAIGQYCEAYLGPTSKIPLLRLKPLWVNDVCPLLQGTKCKVHDSKPIVCRMYPIGRGLFAKDREKGILGDDELELEYVFNGTTCGSNRKKQTVRQWFELFNIPVDDVFFIEWTKKTSYIAGVVQKLISRKVSVESLNLFYDAIFFAFYAGYDISKDFMPQFEKRMIQIMETLTKTEKTMGV